MNTYRVILLNTADVNNVTNETVFVQETKYQAAWQTARAILAGKDAVKGKSLFTDSDCKKAWKRPSDTNEISVVKVFDITVRNKKLDKASLADILADASLSQEAKLEKIALLNK